MSHYLRDQVQKLREENYEMQREIILLLNKGIGQWMHWSKGQMQ